MQIDLTVQVNEIKDNKILNIKTLYKTDFVILFQFV